MAITLCLTPAVALADGPYVPVGSIPAVITVDVTEDSVIWTIDIDMAFAPISNGHIAYGLVVSLDQVHPAFQIHGNDGTDADFAWGTHLYSEWGPTITDGYNGWFTGGVTANNILVSSLGWVEATGERDITVNTDGIFTVAIDKAELGLEFYWAVQVMANTSDTHYPEAWVLWSGDASSFEAVTIPVIEVDIDIKPGSDPNSINPKSKGVIPVAILGSSTFDVADVDVTTLDFEGASPAHDLTDSVVYAEHLQDVNGDGYMDLVSHYRTQATGIAKPDTSATLTGQTTGGTPITGTDTVRAVGK